MGVVEILIIIGAAALVIGVIVAKIVRKAQGKPTCDCDCEGCTRCCKK